MTAVLIGLFLALAASVSQSGGFLCQEKSAAERPPVTARHPVRTIRAMLSHGWWLIGLALATAGFALHLAALALAPISLVQPFVAGGLALAVPLAARAFHHELTGPERRAVLLMAVGLAGLAFGISDTGSHLSFNAGTLALYLGGLGLIAALLISGVRNELRYPALGLAAGLLYAALDSAAKALTDLARTGGAAAVLRSPFWLVAIAAAIAAFFCFQRALQTNRPLTAIALMESGATTGGVLAGFIAFGDTLGQGPALAALHLAAFVAVVVAAWRLAPAQARLAQGSPAGREPVSASHGGREPVPGV